MVKDAEANAEADKERRELVETRNQAESLIHSTKKSIEEHGDKVDPSTVEAIELAIGALEEAVAVRQRRQDQGRDPEPDRSVDEAGRGDLQGPGRPKPKARGADEDEPRSVDEDIVDADFEDLDDDKKRS